MWCSSAPDTKEFTTNFATFDLIFLPDRHFFSEWWKSVIVPSSTRSASIEAGIRPFLQRTITDGIPAPNY
jgi:hypothetical protein